MQTVTLTALRPLRGDFGFAHQGQSFEASIEEAESLEIRGLAERPRPVRFVPPTFTTKVTEPAENKMIDLRTSKRKPK